jgi:hypothetical protein
LLPQVEASRNSSYHSVLKASPDQVYAETVDMDAVVERNLKTASDKMDAYKSTEFQVGDKVFVSSAAIYSAVRDRYKANQGKLIIVKFARGTAYGASDQDVRMAEGTFRHGQRRHWQPGALI